MTQTTTRSLAALCQQLDLDPHAPDAPALDAETTFSLKVPSHFLAQIQPGDWQDPLLRQILPLACEKQVSVGFSKDPVGDQAALLQPGLIQKYAHRALLIASPKCDVHCRYCFRRHYPYEQATQPHWRAALQTLDQRPDITELILSGGDPLSLSEGSFLTLLDHIDALTHIKILRVHSRTPVVAPDRIKASWRQRLAQFSKKVVWVVHCNHAQELSAQTRQLFQQCQAAGMVLLNQSVLLKHINDSVSAQATLNEALFDQGVLPYYCHRLDPVEGGGHFQVSDHQAWQLWQALRQTLPGYLVPKLVKELPGEPYKTWIGLDHPPTEAL